MSNPQVVHGAEGAEELEAITRASFDVLRREGVFGAERLPGTRSGLGGKVMGERTLAVGLGDRSKVFRFEAGVDRVRDDRRREGASGQVARDARRHEHREPVLCDRTRVSDDEPKLTRIVARGELDAAHVVASME